MMIKLDNRKLLGFRIAGVSTSAKTGIKAGVKAGVKS
jgi:hypothetical protein